MKKNFSDGTSITDLVEGRNIESRSRSDIDQRLQMHPALIRRLTLERELEGHGCCVNALDWNSDGSLLVSGSYIDAQINIWSYSNMKLLHSIKSGDLRRMNCTKFMPNTCDELVASGAGDKEVRIFNLPRLSPSRPEENAIVSAARFQCHAERVMKLAVEVGNPSLVWSASEDGTLRQHDLREGNSCPPAGSSHQECRNVLLDLRSGAKRSLSETPKNCLQLKSCDISTTCPHLLLVGGSDAFARLYDRRKLPQMSSCQMKLKPPPCVNFFCPLHLSDSGRPRLQLTHVTFSPIGDEVLLSYSNEHVYLMDVNLVGNKRTEMETPKQQALTKLEKCKELVQAAEISLDGGTNYLNGIEACNEVLDGNVPEIGPELMHECLCIRAALFLKRRWINDVHMAIRDCKTAQSIDSSSFKAYYHLSEAFLQLDKHEEALAYAVAAQGLAPLNSDMAERVESIKEHLAAAEAEKCSKENGSFGSEREDSRDSTAANGSFGSSLASSSQNDNTAYQFEAAIYMKQRYVGHCSANTGIQQASFLGQRGEYVASGSDDGRWFVWEKRTGRLIKMLVGDCSAVNCVQCHPSDCVVATSGDDSSIKIWTPTASGPDAETADVFSTMELNQQTMRHRRDVLVEDELEWFLRKGRSLIERI